MYKMIVIDDEYLVRLGIRETIDWKVHQIEIVGEADNGLEGLRLIETLKPDIVLTDIKMPVMDGIELIKRIKDYDCIPVILSGYKDFDYAKETLENGAYSYLLKPIDNDELVAVVTQALRKLLDQRKKNRYLQHLDYQLPHLGKRLLKQLVEGAFNELEEVLHSLRLYEIPLPEEGRLIYAEAYDVDRLYKEEDVKEALATFYSLLSGRLEKEGIDHFGFSDESELVLLVKGITDRELAERIEACLIRYEQDHRVVLSIGISDPYVCLSHLPKHYEQAVQASRSKLFPTLNTVSVYNSHIKKYKPQVIQAMKYIADHYHENLTVKAVADALYISDSYLMHLFRENVGKTFNEVLTEYRMLMAKKLLLTHQYKVYEIAEMVGYSDVKYFSQVFRKYEGMSPSEFAERAI